jgi:plasmid stability protein
VVASTPSFLGCDPACAPLLGSLLRPLAGPEDLARELIRSLAAPLQHRALLLGKAPSDIIGGNRTTVADGDRVLSLVDIWRAPFSDAQQWAAQQAASDAQDDLADLDDDEHAVLALSAAPKGLPAAEMDAEQRELLRRLLATYLDRVPEEVSLIGRYAEDAALDVVHFAWAGSTSPGERHYYRLQGPRLLIEWDNTQRNVNHAHAAWRDPQGDFGLDVLAAHRAAHH